jgi:hypothetical protein
MRVLTDGGGGGDRVEGWLRGWNLWSFISEKLAGIGLK